MAEAAGSRENFSDMHDILFQTQEAVEDEDLISYAAELHRYAAR